MSLQKSSLLDSFLEDLSGGLETIEQNIGLLENQKEESILPIFRTFHSLKSGSRILNYHHFSDFLHQAENLLSLLRSGELEPSKEILQILYQTTDLIKEFRDLVSENLAEKDFVSNPLWVSKIAEITNLYPQFSGKPQNISIESEQQQNFGLKSYRLCIDFDPEIFITGSDPMIFIEEFFEKNQIIRCKTDLKNLPAFEKFDPTQYYLDWKIVFKSSLSRNELLAIFEFLDESKNKITLEEIKEKEPMIESQTPHKENHTQDFVRVNIKKLDEILNLFGEMVSGFSQMNGALSHIKDEKLIALSENVSNNLHLLQGKMLGIRMVSLAPLFNQFQRFTKETSDKLGKQAEFKISGEETEVDKNIADHLREPLLHLLRNALDHGIETPEVRKALGKNPSGNVSIDASVRENNVYIVISDDGQGLNREQILKKALESKLINGIELKNLSEDEIDHFIFSHGFTTKQIPDELSGRGVGMDIVKEQIEKMRGSILIETEKNKGTSFTLKLPITLSLLDIFTFRVGKDIFGLPAFYVHEIAKIRNPQFTLMEGILPLIEYKGLSYPLFFLNQFFKTSSYEHANLSKGLFFLLEVEKKLFFLFADQFIGQQQAVVKKIPQLEQFRNGILGSSFLPDGEILFILDIFVLFKQLKELRIKTE